MERATAAAALHALREKLYAREKERLSPRAALSRQAVRRLPKHQLGALHLE